MDIFVSYSVMDQELADGIASQIKRAGLTYFLAPKSIPAGASWSENIRAELRTCRCLVVLLSQNSVKSEWVITEWGAAWALNKFIIPVLFQCKHEMIPARLAELQACDYKKFGPAIKRAASQIRSIPSTDLTTGTQQPVVLDADDIQPAFVEICKEAEERLRLFLHVLGPPKITDDLAKEIAQRIDDRKMKPRPLSFSPVLALDLERTPDWFWPMFDERDKIYADLNILELTASRFFHTPKPSGIDVAVIDRQHVMFMTTVVEGAAGTQTGLLFRNNNSLANIYAEWFDRMIWGTAILRPQARSYKSRAGRRKAPALTDLHHDLLQRR